MIFYASSKKIEVFKYDNVFAQKTLQSRDLNVTLLNLSKKLAKSIINKKPEQNDAELALDFLS